MLLCLVVIVFIIFSIKTIKNLAAEIIPSNIEDTLTYNSPFSKNRVCRANEERHMYCEKRPSTMSVSLQCGDEAIKAEAELEICVQCVTLRTKDILCVDAEMLLTWNQGRGSTWYAKKCPFAEAIHFAFYETLTNSKTLKKIALSVDASSDFHQHQVKHAYKVHDLIFTVAVSTVNARKMRQNEIVASQSSPGSW